MKNSILLSLFLLFQIHSYCQNKDNVDGLKLKRLKSYHGINNINEPLLDWVTEQFRIRVYLLENGTYRYSSWNKNSSVLNKPSLVIDNGQHITDGNMGNYHYLFKSGDYSYECWVDFLDTDGFSGSLMVYKKDDLILREKVLLSSGKKTNISEQRDYLINNSIKYSIPKIMKTFEVFKTPGSVFGDNIYSILELDVYSYYNLNDEFNSELQKKAYSKSENYRKQLNLLKIDKRTLLEKTYLLKASDIREIESFLTGKILKKGYEVEYDLKQGGFFISIGYVSYLGCFSFVPKIISNFEFSTLPIIKKWNKYKDGYGQEFFIKVNEEIGLEIENNREDIDILFLFQIKGIEEIEKPSKKLSKCKPIKVITTKGLRVLVFNKLNNKIYFDKVYN